VLAFEVLDSSGESLKGGFSTAYAGGGIWGWLIPDINGKCDTTNNCNGGNCVSGCGTK
jgi:hypothetical protein